MELKKEIGFRLKELRQKLNLTQLQLAKELNTTQQNVTGFENESSGISDKYKNILFEKFNVNIHWLVTGKGSMFLENTTKNIEESKIEINELTTENKKLKKEVEDLKNKNLKLYEELVEINRDMRKYHTDYYEKKTH